MRSLIMAGFIAVWIAGAASGAPQGVPAAGAQAVPDGRGDAAAPGKAGVPAAQMLQRQGTVTLKVQDFDAARVQAEEEARLLGGDVAGAKTLVDGKGRKHGWIRFSLPFRQTGAFLTSVYGLGKLYAANLQVTDNQSNYEELQRHVGSLQAHELRLEKVLNEPRRLRGSDVLFLQDRIFNTSLDEDSLIQHRIDLARAAQSSMIELDLFEPGAMPAGTAPPPPGPEARFRESLATARNGIGVQIARGATAAAYVLAYAPVWGPALVIAILLLVWAVRLILRRREAIRAFARRVMNGVVAIGRALWEARNRRLGHWPGGVAGED